MIYGNLIWGFLSGLAVPVATFISHGLFRERHALLLNDMSTSMD